MNARMEEGKVLVPWDFSENSIQALKAALETTGDSSQIRVVHVATPHTNAGPATIYESTEKQQTRQIQERFRRHFRRHTEFADVSFHVSYGRVAQEIVRLSTVYETRLVVMAASKRRGISRFWSSKLPEQIIRIAKCPVLVVQADEPNKRAERPRFLPKATAEVASGEKRTSRKLVTSYRHGL